MLYIQVYNGPEYFSLIPLFYDFIVLWHVDILERREKIQKDVFVFMF